MRKYYDGQATSGGGGEQPEERNTNLPFKQPFEDFEQLTVFIQQMASSGMVPHGSGWTSFLYELNKVCTEARLNSKKEPVLRGLIDRLIDKIEVLRLMQTTASLGSHVKTSLDAGVFYLEQVLEWLESLPADKDLEPVYPRWAHAIEEPLSHRRQIEVEGKQAGKTFDVEKAIAAQKKLQDEKGYPYFAPGNGRCYNCHRQIYAEIDHGTFKTGVSVEKASGELITGCPHCNHSYCE